MRVSWYVDDSSRSDQFRYVTTKRTMHMCSNDVYDDCSYHVVLGLLTSCRLVALLLFSTRGTLVCGKGLMSTHYLLAFLEQKCTYVTSGRREVCNEGGS